MSAVDDIGVEQAHAAAAELIGPAIAELARIRSYVGEYDKDAVLAMGQEYIANTYGPRVPSDSPYPYAFGMVSEVLASVDRNLASLWRCLCDIERHLVPSDDEDEAVAS